jgi:hypothetical protein
VTPDDPTAVVASGVPVDVRVDLRYRASRLGGEVAGTPIDVLLTGTREERRATGTIGSDTVDARWRIDPGAAGAGLPALLALRSAGTEVLLEGAVPSGDGSSRMVGAAGAVTLAWSDRAGGQTLAVEGAVAGLEVELTIVWSAEHAGGVVWGSVGDEALALDARPAGDAMAVSGRYGGAPLWVLPAVGALLLPGRLEARGRR